MSSHCVVVWEYQSEGQWLPHTPGVTRTLERAHTKKLTRVVLADADPALKGHYVNLRTLTQCQETPDGGTVECPVRRACYSAGGAGGRGARWEWAPLVSPPLPAELTYEPMPMELQCVLEGAWCAGAEGAGAVSWRGWALCVSRGTARRGAALRLLRRVSQPPYPRDPPPHPHPPHPPDRPNRTVPVRRSRIPQQHTGSSVHSVHSTTSNVSNVSIVSSQPAAGAGGAGAARAAAAAGAASPRDRKPGLARQILHNLNIFSNNNKQASPAQAQAQAQPANERERSCERARERAADAECGSTRSGRRHSVDTVSTYLSHESKDSLQRGSVAELLDCSAGSDDVFEPAAAPAPPPAPPPPPAPRAEPPAPPEGAVAGRGAEPLSARVGALVRAVQCPQWGALCPVCLQPLGGGGAALALRACQHMMHLHCLAARLRDLQDPLYIECLVCGRVYGAEPPGPARAPPAPPAGAQPPGSMAWRLQHAPLPQQDTHTSILVTYNFQSGRQGEDQPEPGAPYYAVGFPRHSLLPDTALGRQVLSALRVAWERRVLFAVCASQTTGREYVVAWRVAPPPGERAHYAPPATPARLLLSALSRLHGLINPHEA